MENALVGRIMFNPTRRDFITKGGVAVLAGTALGGTLELEGCNALQWINTALSDLPAVLQIVTSITGIVAAAQGGVVSQALTAQLNNGAAQAQKDLNTAKTLIAGYQAAPNKGTALGDIDAALVDAQNNLSSILEAFHVSDPVLQSTIAASLGLAIATTLGIQALIPPPPAAVTARLSMRKENGANAIKEAFNVIVGRNYPKSILAIS